MSAGNDRPFIDWLQNKERKEQAMKCPKLKFFRQFPGAEEQPIFGDCILEECAWWDKPSDRCAILQGAMELGHLGYLLGEIKDKMPHAEQFTK